MAAMKPRTGDGPLEVTKEGRGIIMRVPLEGGGRLVVELTPDEADALGADDDELLGGHGRGGGAVFALDGVPEFLLEVEEGLGVESGRPLGFQRGA